ncbi:MAG: HAMP domain-containing histidine kinase [Clostridiales Family XIII bacterium]|jgi:signal transduction histidine kinase|nr:HAMP domain-containing histidine kinase [Clostridiales Family XIII bacterium]
MKAPKLRTATRLALVFTAIMSGAAVAIYLLFVNFFTIELLNWEIAVVGVYESAGLRTWEVAASSVRVLIPVLIAVILGSFLLSSLIIDRVLNPLREMTEKLHSIAGRNYKTKIFIDSSEEELREYAIAFNDMTAKVNDHIERQKRFISDASHELTTPVAVIAGHSDMLLRWGKDEAALLADSLATVRREAFAMNELIENLLFFARSDSGRQQYRMRRIDAAAFAEECLSEQRLLHPDFRIELDADKGARIALRADADALRRVFRILLDNAVKYSEETKAIRVSLDADEGTARIRVSDSGVGMERRHLEKIFDRFYRADDSRTRESGGSGLGLAIAKEIVGAHGGEIEADSAPGAGTTVTIRLRAYLR